MCVLTDGWTWSQCRQFEFLQQMRMQRQNDQGLHVAARWQVDEEPPIRANTTILLGNLADHLSEATQKRVLLNAFTRALKDLFPPARVAGLRVQPRPSAPFSHNIKPEHVLSLQAADRRCCSLLTIVASPRLSQLCAALYGQTQKPGARVFNGSRNLKLFGSSR